MADDVNIGSASIDLRVDDSKLKSDWEKIKSDSKKSVEQMNTQLSKIKLSVDASALKMKFDDAVKWRNDLQMKFEKQIKMNADVSTIQKTKAALDAVNGSLAGMKKTQDDITDRASKWGMIATGINQSVQAIKEFFSQIKQLVGQSISSAAELEVLRSNFKGTAEDIELFRRATAGTVSEASLIKLANQGNYLGLTMRETALLLSFADDRTDSLGGTVEEVMQKLIIATEAGGRGLKDAGIQVQVYNQLVEQMAKQHGDTITNLDAETQKRIRLQALIQASGITIDDVLKKQKDEKDLIDATGITLEEAKLKFGKFIGEGLTPLLRAYDNSSKGVKNLIALMVGVGGVVINAIPLIVQLVTAKKLLGIQSLITAGQVSTETIAVKANTAAKVANSRVVLGMLGKAGAVLAVAYATYELTRMINENTEAIKKNREEANLNIGFGQQYGSNKPSTTGTANFGGFFSSGGSKNIVVGTNNKIADSVYNVRNRILELQKANESVNITWAQYFRNLIEIENLQKRLQLPKGETQSSYTPVGADAKGAMLIPSKGIRSLSKVQQGSEAPLDNSFIRDLTDTDILETWISQSEAAMNASNTLFSSFYEGLSQIKIRTKETATAVEQTFASMANIVIAEIERIIAKWAVLNIFSFVGGGPGVNLFKMLFGHDGGTFYNQKKFAAGVNSYMVPSGYPNDSYPVFVQSGEDLRVRTPQQRAMAEMDNRAVANALSNLNRSIRSFAMNNNNMGAEVSMPIMLDGETIGYAAVKFMNKATRRGRNLSEIV